MANALDNRQTFFKQIHNIKGESDEARANYVKNQNLENLSQYFALTGLINSLLLFLTQARAQEICAEIWGLNRSVLLLFLLQLTLKIKRKNVLFIVIELRNPKECVEL